MSETQSPPAEKKEFEAKKPSESKPETPLGIPIAVEWQKKIAPYIEQIVPLMKKIGVLMDAASPYAQKAWGYLLIVWAFMKKYQLDKYGMAFYGLLMVFFGGQYILLLGAVEAYRLMGWEETQKHLLIIYEDYCRLAEENKKDDMLDEDNNGIADVEEISSKELFTRKVLLFFRVINPDKVAPALQGLYSGFISVVATLRIQFAQTIALGATIGEVFAKFANRTVAPVLDMVCPTDYKKWIPHAIKYGCRSLGVSIAWMIQRVISAFYSAIRGSQLFIRGALEWAHEQKMIDSEIDESSLIYNGLVAGLAGLGFLFQLWFGFGSPFPLNVFLFPLTLAENFLWYWVAVNDSNLPVEGVVAA